MVLAAFAVAAGCAGVKQDVSSGGIGGHAGAGAINTGGSTGILGSGGGAGARVIGSQPVGDMACATFSDQAQQVPLDLYIMMDSSGSMAQPTGANGTGQTKWDAIQSALQSFLQDPQSTGLGVGIQYFPQVLTTVPDTCQSDTDCGNNGPCILIQTCSKPTNGMITECDTNTDCTSTNQGTCVPLGACGPPNNQAACAPPGPGVTCSNGYPCNQLGGYCNARDKCDLPSYTTPAVEVAPLPGVATAIIGSFSQHMPDGLTPTSAALSGAINHAKALATANPTHKVAVLLATDGEPDECTPSDVAGVAGIAKTGLSGTPSILTYVIGVFAASDASNAQMNLNTIASAGGTNQAFIINTSGNVATAFISALNSVRSQGLACQYMVPQPAGDGSQLDYFSVNVQFTPSSGQPVTIGNVKNSASCSSTQGGWYYDVDPSTGATPKTISICPTTCNALKADPSGQVDILLGCMTVYVIG
ncbi:MAG TPA: hypothetical protein VMT03_12575 [Polyangia bacterium]|nr:hypothetical protein [Polyangia bacterium]